MIILTYGMRGAGKTTLLHDLVGLDCHERLYFVAAHNPEWFEGAAHWRGRAPVIHRVYPGQEPPEDLEAGVIVFSNWDPLDVAGAAIARGDCTLVDDELDRAGRRSGWEKDYGGAPLGNPLRRLVHDGRHIANARGEYTEVHVLGACRRPVNLHTDLSELADSVYVFRLQGSNTIGRLIADGHLDEGEEEKLVTAPNFTCRHYPSGAWLDIDPL